MPSSASFVPTSSTATSSSTGTAVPIPGPSHFGHGNSRRGSSSSTTTSRSTRSSRSYERSRAPKLSMSAGSHSGLAEAVVDRRHATATPTASSHNTSSLSHEPPPKDASTATATSTLQSNPNPLETAVLPSSHHHAHLPHGGGKLLKNIVGVFKKRPPTSTDSSPSHSRQTSMTTSQYAHAHKGPIGRPLKSPRITTTHTSPSMSPTMNGRGQKAGSAGMKHKNSPRNSPFLVSSSTGDVQVSVNGGGSFGYRGAEAGGLSV